MRNAFGFCPPWCSRENWNTTKIPAPGKIVQTSMFGKQSRLLLSWILRCVSCAEAWRRSQRIRPVAYSPLVVQPAWNRIPMQLAKFQVRVKRNLSHDRLSYPAALGHTLVNKLQKQTQSRSIGGTVSFSASGVLWLLCHWAHRLKSLAQVRAWYCSKSRSQTVKLSHRGFVAG